MQTKQLIVRSAVTVVATGLTLLSSGTTQAGDRGFSGMRMGGAGGGMNSGAFHQNIANRAMNLRRDDRGGRGERERGDDQGRGRYSNVAMTTARERERGDDRGHRREPRDDRGGR